MMNLHGSMETGRVPITLQEWGNDAMGHAGPKRTVGWVIFFGCGCNVYQWIAPL